LTREKGRSKKASLNERGLKENWFSAKKEGLKKASLIERGVVPQ
jgi:hypothetical protein